LLWCGSDTVTDSNCNRDGYCHTYWDSGSYRNQHADGDGHGDVNRHSYRNSCRICDSDGNANCYARSRWQRLDPAAGGDR
jgi:hypothetical protein